MRIKYSCALLYRVGLPFLLAGLLSIPPGLADAATKRINAAAHPEALAAATGSEPISAAPSRPAVAPVHASPKPTAGRAAKVAAPASPVKPRAKGAMIFVT